MDSIFLPGACQGKILCVFGVRMEAFGMNADMYSYRGSPFLVLQRWTLALVSLPF